MAKRKHQSRRSLAMEQADGLFSLDINTGVEILRPEDLLQREMPGTVNDAFVRARAWHRDNWFVEAVTLAQTAFCNYGLRIIPARKGAKRKLDDVLADPKERMELKRLVRDVWNEWKLQDTVVAFWRKEAETRPFLFLPETCEYSDRFGYERLRVSLNYKKSDLAEDGKNGLDGLPPDVIQRYTGSTKIVLSEDKDEYFKVLTRGLRGQGFGWPRLRRVFRTLSQNESMEVGESQLAYAGRLVIRQHKIGFEVRAGANAMRQEAFLYKQKRATAIQQFYQGRAGFTENVTQFDHNIGYVWIDPKLYDARKWETIINRMLWWAGPVGFMIIAKTISPYLLQVYEAETRDDRDLVGDFCEHIIKEGWGLDVKLVWSNRCFRDSRLAWDMVKFFTQQGPLSLTTGLEEGGFDPEEEAQRKKSEKQRKEELIPLWDPSHGKRPGQSDPGRPNGKKTGSDD